MPASVRDLLERAAGHSSGPDTQAVLARSRQLGRRRRAVRTAAALAVLPLAVALVARMTLTPDVLFNDPIDDQGVEPTPAIGEILRIPPPGEVTPSFRADRRPVWVVRHHNGEVSVLDALSPHRPDGLGKLVVWCPRSAWFDDPIHGSRFDAWGRWVGGPAPHGLWPYAVEREGNGVRVGVRQRPPARDADAARPPRGAPCDHTPEDYPQLMVRHAWPFADAVAPQAALAEEGWVLVSATLFVPLRGPPQLCAAVTDTVPPRCSNGVAVAGLQLDGSGGGLVMSGRFLARTAGFLFTELIRFDTPAS
jgi:hypothetical protein